MLNDLPKGTWRTGIILRFIFLASNFNFFLQLMIFRISGSHPTLSSWLKPETFPLELILMVYFIPVHLPLIKTLISLGEII